MQISLNEAAMRIGREGSVTPKRGDLPPASQNKAMESQEEERRLPEMQLTAEMVQALAEASNKIAEAFKIEIRFEVHEETKLRKMTIVNPRSGAVIREIPPEAILDMIGKMWERIGIIIDKKV